VDNPPPWRKEEPFFRSTTIEKEQWGELTRRRHSAGKEREGGKQSNRSKLQGKDGSPIAFAIRAEGGPSQGDRLEGPEREKGGGTSNLKNFWRESHVRYSSPREKRKEATETESGGGEKKEGGKGDSAAATAKLSARQLGGKRISALEQVFLQNPPKKKEGGKGKKFGGEKRMWIVPK